MDERTREFETKVQLIGSLLAVFALADLFAFIHQGFSLPAWTVFLMLGAMLLFAGVILLYVIWDIGETTTAPMSIPRLRDGLARFSFLPDGLVLAGGFDGGATVVETSTGEGLYELELDGRPFNYEVIASPAGSRLAVPQAEASISVLDASSGEEVARTASGQPRAVAFSPDDRLLLHTVPMPTFLSSDQNGYAITELSTGRPVAMSDHSRTRFVRAEAGALSHSGDVAVLLARRADFDPDHPFGAAQTSNATRALVVHDATTGEILADVVIDFAPSSSELPAINEIAISPDARLVATVDVTSVLRMYDLVELIESGSTVGRLDQVVGVAEAGRFGLAFTEDSSTIITGERGSLTAHSADAGLDEQWTIELGSQEPLTVLVRDGVVWTSLEERLFQGRGSADGLVGFSLDVTDMASTAAQKLTRAMSDSECRQYLGLDSCEDRLALGPL